MKDGYYVVKPWGVMKKDYGFTDPFSGNIGTGDYPFIWDMEESMPKGRVIYVKNNVWEVYHVTPEMLLGPHIPYGTTVEVRDTTDEQWMPDIFVTYAPEIESRTVLGVRGRWKMVRVPKESEIKIKITCGDKELKLSDISEETLLKLRNMG